jgi:uncharacterized membrane protein
VVAIISKANMKYYPLIGRIILSFFFISVGIFHLISPKAFLLIMPSYLPIPLALVYISGVAELLGGMAIMIPFLRKMAAWGLIVLLIAVFPANIYALQNGMTIAGHSVPHWILILRLPVQFIFIYWVYGCCLKKDDSRLRKKH